MRRKLENTSVVERVGSSYRADLFVAFVIRSLFFTAILAMLAVLAAGCSRSAGDPISLGAEQRPNTADGLELGTRNSLPQGGNYEKSDCAPRQSVDGHPPT
ncbi:TPA_asm: hypothetical protein [ssRNA phage Zoerhiza.1_25]|uniref:Uncharacterized protein n=2 Tax=Leviviricetes TaxID=2842243 RepID=A0A8S5L1Z0_9VIRU|nr:hypothetical protein QIP87_gp3 [ssRNA phage Zoerhiza.1_25]QDH89614.1 MAG: hypothetical protein H1Rhizo26FD342_000002 [Leviviridae sp.]DAD51499.1 TPA_asm: hypothetical protein [ssRNA phage Zoerhiza.1_25]